MRKKNTTFIHFDTDHKMIDDVISASFSINIAIMRFFRLYPPLKTSLSYKIQAYAIYFTCIICVPVLTFLQFVLVEEVDVMKANYNAAFVAQTMGFTTKILPFIKRGEEIKRCINYFSDPLFATVENESQKKILKKCVFVCRRNSVVLVIAVIIGVFTWNLRPLTRSGYSLPVDVWLPFDSRADFNLYCLVYFCLSVAIVAVAFMGTIADPLIGGLTYHAACQLKILKDNLQHLKEYSVEVMSLNNNDDREILKEIISKKIKNCVIHHNAVLKFVELFEECFTFVVFSQFAGSTFAICFSVLQLTIMDMFSLNGFNACVCIGVCLAQIYFYCYYGTILFEEHGSLKDAIYMGRWYEYDTDSKKALITMMEYSQKPLIITAGKILDLSLETFAVVIKRTYSLLAVLKNYQ